MWWAIGIAAAVAVIFVLLRVRSGSHQLELATAAENHLRVSYRMMNVAAGAALMQDYLWKHKAAAGY